MSLLEHMELLYRQSMSIIFHREMQRKLTESANSAKLWAKIPVPNSCQNRRCEYMIK